MPAVGTRQSTQHWPGWRVSQLLLPRRKTLTRVVFGGLGIVCGDDRDCGNCEGEQEVTDGGFETILFAQSRWGSGDSACSCGGPSSMRRMVCCVGYSRGGRPTGCILTRGRGDRGRQREDTLQFLDSSKKCVSATVPSRFRARLRRPSTASRFAILAQSTRSLKGRLQAHRCPGRMLRTLPVAPPRPTRPCCTINQQTRCCDVGCM